MQGVAVSDPVSHPSYYTSHPSGVECISITRRMNFSLGNALKYVWRHRDKGNPVQDLAKARQYLRWFMEDVLDQGAIPPAGDEAARLLTKVMENESNYRISYVFTRFRTIVMTDVQRDQLLCASEIVAELDKWINELENE